MSKSAAELRRVSERCVALFCGSRHWPWADREAIWRVVDALPEHAVVVHGGARGADAMAALRARERGLHVAEVPALWDEYGRRAGMKRNEAMLALLPTIAYAFPMPDSVGTYGMIRLAKREGIRFAVCEQAALRQ